MTWKPTQEQDRVAFEVAAVLGLEVEALAQVGHFMLGNGDGPLLVLVLNLQGRINGVPRMAGEARRKLARIGAVPGVGLDA